MDNAQKAIMIGVGLFITIIVIAAVMLITGIGQDMLNSGTTQISGISDTMKQSLYDQYDNKKFALSSAKTAALNLLNQGINVKVNGNDVSTTDYKTKLDALGKNRIETELTYDSSKVVNGVNFK